MATPTRRTPTFRPAHLQPAKDTATQYDRFRGSAASRGYDHHWTKLRNAYLREHPLCEECSSRDNPVVADLVHHKVPVEVAPDRLLDWLNLQALCSTCHARHHASERNARNK